MRNTSSSPRKIRLLAASVLIGVASGALLGAVVASCILVLADFTRVPRDLVLLTLYAVVPLAGLGGAAAGLLTLGALVFSGIRGKPLSVEGFTRRLATLAFGSLALLVAAGAFIVARRPTLVVSLPTLLPILAGAALVVLATYAVGRGRPPGPGRPALRPRTTIAITLASLLLPPVLGFQRPALVGGRRAQSAGLQIARDGAVPKPRVLLLGWDGATWDVIDPLMRKGAMPTLARLVQHGSRGEIFAEPQVIQPFANSASAGARTPALWETIATGKSPLHHGIWDFECKMFEGVEQAVPFRIAGDYRGTNVPMTGDMSRAERLWHMLDRAGISSAVVGWPNTWPARRRLEKGVIVSTLARRNLPDSVQPEGAVDVGALCKDVEAEALRAERDIFSLPADDSRRPWETAATPLEADLLQTFFWYYNDDLCNMRVALDLNARNQPDFVAVYLNLVDIVQHKFWRYYQPEVFGDVRPEEVARYGNALEVAYRFSDEQLAKLLDAMGKDTIVIVLADHGGGPWVFDGLQGIVQTAFRQVHPEYSGNHRLNGILVAAGPGIAQRAAIDDPKHVDIAPTVLHLFGLPMAEDMPGRVLSEAITGEPAGGAPRSIATYETELSEGGLRPTASGVDPEVEQRLRALGYVR